MRNTSVSSARRLGLALASGLALWLSSKASAGEPPRRHLVPVAGPAQPQVRLNVEEHGPAQGRPIVLLHGLGASAYSWRRVIPLLTDRFRVIAIDLRGHGRSDKPFDLHYAPTAQAELIRDAIAKLSLRKVVLVGHSFGGLVSMVAAIQAQNAGERRIERLVIMDAPVFPQPYTHAVHFLRKPVLPYAALTVIPPQIPIAYALMTEAVGMGHITRHDVEIYAQPLFDAGARHALIQTARQIDPVNEGAILAAYPKMRRPTLAIWCRGDQVVPLSTGQRLARTLPRARLKVLDGCDHVPPEQRPRAVARLIADFAEQ